MKSKDKKSKKASNEKLNMEISDSLIDFWFLVNFAEEYISEREKEPQKWNTKCKKVIFRRHSKLYVE